MYAAWTRYDNVKEEYLKMEALKQRAEAADIAKSQVRFSWKLHAVSVLQVLWSKVLFFVNGSSLQLFLMKSGHPWTEC